MIAGLDWDSTRMIEIRISVAELKIIADSMIVEDVDSGRMLKEIRKVLKLAEQAGNCA